MSIPPRLRIPPQELVIYENLGQALGRGIFQVNVLGLTLQGLSASPGCKRHQREAQTQGLSPAQLLSPNRGVGGGWGSAQVLAKHLQISIPEERLDVGSQLLPQPPGVLDCQQLSSGAKWGY